jgi:hypothetical protein
MLASSLRLKFMIVVVMVCPICVLARRFFDFYLGTYILDDEGKLSLLCWMSDWFMLKLLTSVLLLWPLGLLPVCKRGGFEFCL